MEDLLHNLESLSKEDLEKDKCIALLKQDLETKGHAF